MRKRLFLGVICIAFIVGCLLYFKPLKLADLVSENQYIAITYQEFDIKDGSPSINSTNYNEITEDEKDRIIDILKRYSYKRTFKTLFSDGSLTKLSDKAINIYIYGENNKLVNTILAADSDTISVNEKNYVLNNSSLFIKELLEVITK